MMKIFSALKSTFKQRTHLSVSRPCIGPSTVRPHEHVRGLGPRVGVVAFWFAWPRSKSDSRREVRPAQKVKEQFSETQYDDNNNVPRMTPSRDTCNPSETISAESEHERVSAINFKDVQKMQAHHV